VLSFFEGTKDKRKVNGLYEFEITVTDEPPGLVVDGQQRLSALQSIGDRTFEVMVSAIVCPNEDELRKQFILINNTRPLPKQLIYELLPTVDGLPHRLSSRSTASSLIERLNYDPTSSLCGQIKQHTNPMGTIRDTALQRLCLNSLETGIIRVLMQKNNGLDVSFKLISEFFKAVQEVFPESWYEHNPTTSRLIHGAGITAMGFVMDFLNARNNSTLSKEFKPGLEKLKPHCAWTEGTWNFAKNNIRPWNSLQNLPKDFMELSLYLIRVIKQN
jgi:DGQHR domain-containing protein